jgi:hypothetical protein
LIRFFDSSFHIRPWKQSKNKQTNKPKPKPKTPNSLRYLVLLAVLVSRPICILQVLIRLAPSLVHARPQLLLTHSGL